ncbi:MAG: MFS transporter [Mycobacteriales bacterium]
MADRSSVTVLQALDEAPLSTFHLKAVVTSGMGFFTDAYDLFIIGTATLLIKEQWHLGASQVGLINSTALLAAFIGALVFGRLADLFGRKSIYAIVAVIMIVGAVASAVSPTFWWLIVSRFILGLGIGGDYPVSAVLMSEYSNQRDRGKLVGLVFSMQALGTIVGPVVGLTLLSTHMNPQLAWRLMLGLGAIPAAAVLAARRRMPESPRYTARVLGDSAGAWSSIREYSSGVIAAGTAAVGARRISLRAFLTDRRHLLTLLGTAGSWFAFDYAYYGNSISSPVIVKEVLGAHSTITEALAFNLIVFAVAAVPGYYLAVWFMDRIGHRRLQFIGFPLMGLALLLIGVIPGLTVAATPFLLLFGVSYFFAEFGPNTTTFVLASEVFPASARTTGHGISAGIAKFGAFVGVYLFPVFNRDFGLRGSLLVAAGFSLVGMLLTFCIPEPGGRSLEEVAEHDTAGPLTVADAASLILLDERAAI